MKVRVSYSLELEDVVSLVNNIISDCQQKLINESKNLKYYAGDLNRLHGEIERTRKVLNLIDTQLEDVLNMATGLKNVQSPPVLPDKEKETEGEEEKEVNENES